MQIPKFFAELKRRKVYRVAIAYAVVSWLLIQIATQVFPFFEIPNWTIRLVISLLVLGFPVALLLSWAFDLTTKGVVRTDELPVAPTPRPKSAPVPEKSIAVLPFENLSDSQENEYFADGIQDDVLANLAKIADLKVISRTSVRQYRTGTRNLRDIGEALGVAHILEGTVRRAGNRVRVNVQLINARSDAHLWADTFDRELVDLFALQSELAERITVALRANLSPQEKAGLRIHSTADLEAYENFLRARDLFRWSGAGDPRENGEKALRFLERAIARDPKFALAYCQVSRWHTELFWFGYDRKTSRLEDGKKAAETALRLQPDLGDAHLALAYYHYFGFRDYDRARAELEIARRTTPNDAEVWDATAAIDRRQGSWELCRANFEKARELDPRNVSVIWNLAETYALLGRFEDAERTIADGLEVNPNAYFFLLERASIELHRTGNTSAMHQALGNIPREFDPGGGVTLVALRLSLMERNYAEGARLLASSPHQRFNDTGLGGAAGTLDGYSFPRSWYEGLVARGRGDDATAQLAFAASVKDVDCDLNCCADDAKAVAFRALVQSALGRKAEALSDARDAVARLPVARDAYDGPMLATNLAVVCAQLGEHDLALAQLEELRGLPMGPTPAILRVEPEWDALREHARFEKLLSE